MDLKLIRRANVAVFVAVVIVAGYVATLLVNNYLSQKRLLVESRQRFIHVIEKQAMAVGYFFSEREQDLKELSNSKEISTYFENKALGMSYEYGLMTSLMEMQQHFANLSKSREIGGHLIYDWIAFVQPDGVPIAGVYPDGKNNITERIRRISKMSLRSYDIMLTKGDDETHAIITVPYFFKNRFAGYIAADVPLCNILNNLVRNNGNSKTSKSYIYCDECTLLFPENEMVAKILLAEGVAKQKDSEGVFASRSLPDTNRSLALLYAPISNTELWLVTLLFDDEIASGLRPGDALLALLLLSILIFGGVGLTIRSNLQKRLLAGRYEESHRNASEIQRKNEALSAEVAERKKAEAALEKANRELKETSITLNHMLRSATEFAIAAVDSEYRIIHFNPAAERILDVEANEVMGKIVTDIHSLRNVKKERFDAGIAAAIKDGKYEYDVISENEERGEQRLHAVVMPMHDEANQIVGFIFFAVDTTRQYESEVNLRLSEERYRTLIENMPDIIFALDSKLVVRDINLPNVQPYGLKAEDIIGKTFASFIHVDDRESVMELVRMDLDRQRKYRRGLSFRMVSNDKGVHWVDLNLHYQYDDSGYLTTNGVLRDTTEQKLLEGQLIRSERLAAAGQLAASIAHEINSPLAGISALLALIRKKNLEDHVTLENIDLVQQAFQSIGSIVKNLLDLCRPGLEAYQQTDLNSTIEKAVALSKAYLRKNEIGVEMDLVSTVPPFNCHPQEIGQVLLNLINNSVEAFNVEPNGRGRKIIIKTNTAPDKVIVEYLDTGPGISDQFLEKIFDPFYTNKKTFGMGIGLSICHDIVVRNNGTIVAMPSTSGAHFVIEFKTSHADPNLKKIPTETADSLGE